MLTVATSALALALMLAAGGLASAEPAASPYQHMRDGTPLDRLYVRDVVVARGKPALLRGLKKPDLPFVELSHPNILALMSGIFLYTMSLTLI